MTDQEALERALARWKAAFGQYSALKSAAEAAVVRWEWTDGTRYSPLPFYFKRHPGRARPLKAPPASKSQRTEYGLDEQKRPRVRRLYNYQEKAFETFFCYDANPVEIVKFSPRPHIPLGVEQVYYEQDRVVWYAMFGLNGYAPLYSRKARRGPDALLDWLGYNGRLQTAECYRYDGERLATIDSYHERPGASPFRIEERFCYDEAGRLARIEGHYENGWTRTVYRRRVRGQSFKSIREATTNKLVEAVIERLRAEAITDTLCCIELAYRTVTNHFPPYIMLGPQGRRQALLDSGDPDARFWVFTPGMYDQSLWLEITDPATLQLCQQMEQEIQMGQRWETATDILRDVAAALTRHDWSGILDVTPDFVVFAIDHEMDDLVEALSASVSQEQIAAWQAKGWL
ncbi:MAG: hypothetical protein JXJ20_01890 [Anaerolineae bacterium]|nr:hypothetical protein [Anaerolineae bacterium]